MTKLLEWLSCATVIFGVWFATITSNSVLIKEWREIILFLPIISLFLFGLYAITIVLFRVFTFNNCESAAIELQRQIEEAKKDLQSKGIILQGTDVSSTL
ncbi:PREDICTED: dolichol-phosphate mannosyltransferase subunit 3 [Atta cephalotes]|uniref:Dolichol-phosphate mannosyltransferase subunit 3 n=2 Tax=Atta TaxID=12956 RepID=A0A158NTT3_ATTCE|nr:PREDICTED: dolichol-phosphate mannosyltransferase subunit 3 [Atta cephalotes]XP_018044595.1 PREDICTED: dolichol-phosphate mannosyltransferase subunit 3 [Atta colombica]KYM87077.1 Dolichol-phosphate mannosyltransferase subunit 3 [Atta colombica]